jgi:AbrB family looped-hinge helix DNA binding protein
MRATIDAAGRIVIRTKIREEAGFEPGMPLEVTVCDGKVEIEPPR